VHNLANRIVELRTQTYTAPFNALTQAINQKPTPELEGIVETFNTGKVIQAKELFIARKAAQEQGVGKDLEKAVEVYNITSEELEDEANNLQFATDVFLKKIAQRCVDNGMTKQFKQAYKLLYKLARSANNFEDIEQHRFQMHMSFAQKLGAVSDFNFLIEEYNNFMKLKRENGVKAKRQDYEFMKADIRAIRKEREELDVNRITFYQKVKQMTAIRTQAYALEAKLAGKANIFSEADIKIQVTSLLKSYYAKTKDLNYPIQFEKQKLAQLQEQRKHQIFDEALLIRRKIYALENARLTYDDVNSEVKEEFDSARDHEAFLADQKEIWHDIESRAKEKLVEEVMDLRRQTYAYKGKNVSEGSLYNIAVRHVDMMGVLCRGGMLYAERRWVIMAKQERMQKLTSHLDNLYTKTAQLHNVKNYKGVSQEKLNQRINMIASQHDNPNTPEALNYVSDFLIASEQVIDTKLQKKAA